MLIKCALVSVSLAFYFALISAENNDSWSALPSLMKKVYGDCERKDYEISDCLKIKVVSLLDRVSKSEVIELDESMKLVREGDRTDYGRALSENDIEGSLNADGEQKSTKLTEMVFDRVSKFLNSHSLKIHFPKFDAAALARDIQEGRGKMKKTMGMFMMAAMMKAMMMIPMSIGTLFILAGKALIISKIALVLSLIILLKKLLTKPTEHVVHESHGWNPSAGSGGWDRRSYKLSESPYNQNPHAQHLAYSSYIKH